MASCASPISHQRYLSDHHLSPFPMSSFASPNSRSSISDFLHINDAISLHSSPISLSVQKKKMPAGSPAQKNQVARKTTEATHTASRVVPVPHGDDDWKENIREYNGAAQPGNSACLQATPSSMKRKRPAKLDIPEFARLASFGKAKEFELPQPEESCLEPKGYETAVFGVYSRKGRKECMEDTHTAVTEFRGKPGQALFAVFDGHGGRHAATFAADNLAKHVSMALDQKSLVDAMQASYLALDSEFLSKNTSSGACSVSALLTDGHLTVANAGDCKAVLCRNGKAEALNTIHRASNAEERQRIESLGGYVDCFNGVWRVQGTLAVTRAFGDLNLKQWVSAEPEVTHMVLSKDCEFLILATDGLWDAMGDQEAVDCVRESLNLRLEPESPRTPLLTKTMQHGSYRIDTEQSNGVPSLSKMEACKKLVHTACSRGNLDDITVVIVILQGFSKPAE